MKARKTGETIGRNRRNNGRFEGSDDEMLKALKETLKTVLVRQK